LTGGLSHDAKEDGGGGARSGQSYSGRGAETESNERGTGLTDDSELESNRRTEGGMETLTWTQMQTKATVWDLNMSNPKWDRKRRMRMKTDRQ
jgi:hypothetical protein